MTDPRPTQDQPDPKRPEAMFGTRSTPTGGQGGATPSAHGTDAFPLLGNRKAIGVEPTLPQGAPLFGSIEDRLMDLSLKLEEAKVRGIEATAKCIESEAELLANKAKLVGHRALKEGHRATAEPRRQAMNLRERAAALRLTAMERVTRVVLAVVVTAVVLGIAIASWIISPLFLSVDLLIACLGAWALKRSPSRPDANDEDP